MDVERMHDLAGLLQRAKDLGMTEAERQSVQHEAVDLLAEAEEWLRTERPPIGTPDHWAVERGDSGHPYVEARDAFNVLHAAVYPPSPPGYSRGPKNEFAPESVGLDAEAPAPLVAQRVDFSVVEESSPPEFLYRTDGVGMFYRGQLNELHGASESGKSWIALAAAARAIRDGERAGMIDFESDMGTILERLRLLGLSEQEIAERFDYFRPDMSRPVDYSSLHGIEYGVLIIDGITMAIANAEGASTLGNDAVAKLYRESFHALATNTGAAVILVDHVTKADGKSRFALGAVAKLNAITGASYLVQAGAFGRGMTGRIRLWVAKDRPGYLGAHCDRPLTSGLREFGRVVMDSSRGDAVIMTVEPYREQDDADSTTLAQRILLYVQQNPECTQTAIRENVTGRNVDIKAEIVRLTENGELLQKGSGRKVRYSVLDPEDDDYATFGPSADDDD